jgi:hypothetical protein
MEICWIDGFTIRTKLQGQEFAIIANKEGLLSLAAIFKRIAELDVADGYVLHLDEFNSLEDGSVDLVISRMPDK